MCEVFQCGPTRQSLCHIMCTFCLCKLCRPCFEGLDHEQGLPGIYIYIYIYIYIGEIQNNLMTASAPPGLLIIKKMLMNIVDRPMAIMPPETAYSVS